MLLRFSLKLTKQISLICQILPIVQQDRAVRSRTVSPYRFLKARTARTPIAFCLGPLWAAGGVGRMVVKAGARGSCMAADRGGGVRTAA